MENIALRSLQIFYIFVLRVEIVTIFELKVVAISVRNTIIRKFANFVRLYFPHITRRVYKNMKFWSPVEYQKHYPACDVNLFTYEVK